MRIKKLVVLSILVIAVLFISCDMYPVSNVKVPDNEIDPEVKPVEIDLVPVEGGSFWMGAQDSDPNGRNYNALASSYESPVHEVTVSSFYISKYEVTQKQWNAVMGSNPSWFKGDDRPVEKVSWYDAVEFCNALSRKEGRSPAYTVNGENVSWNLNADGYRLPTEAEWEYAARGGKKSKGYVYSGGNTAVDVAWYSDNSVSETYPVGTKGANELGLYDMSGNVGEWCWDWYGDYSSGSQTDPDGPSTGSLRVLRGGSWGHAARCVRVSGRRISGPGFSGYNGGFRLVLPATDNFPSS